MDSARRPFAFISYRREDSALAARYICEMICRQFGTTSVFLDVDSIDSGDEFPTRIMTELERATVVLAIMGPHWLAVTDKYTFFRDIGDAVNSAQGYIILVSNDFRGSPWTLDELKRAIIYHTERNAPVCPVFLNGLPKSSEEVPLGLEGFKFLDGSKLESTIQELSQAFSNLPR